MRKSIFNLTQTGLESLEAALPKNNPDAMDELELEEVKSDIEKNERDLKEAIAAVEDASAVLEEMKQVIVQHEANVNAMEPKEEGVGVDNNGDVVSVNNPEPTGEDTPASEGSEESTPEDDTGSTEPSEAPADEGSSEEQPKEDEGSEETAKEDSEGEEPKEEVEPELNEESTDAEVNEAAKNLNLAGESIAGSLGYKSYSDLLKTIGYQNPQFGLNSMLAFPRQNYKASLEAFLNVKGWLSNKLFSNEITKAYEALNNSIDSYIKRVNLKVEVTKLKQQVDAIDDNKVFDLNPENLESNEVSAFVELLLSNRKIVNKNNISSIINSGIDFMNTTALTKDLLSKIENGITKSQDQDGNLDSDKMLELEKDIYNQILKETKSDLSTISKNQLGQAFLRDKFVSKNDYDGDIKQLYSGKGVIGFDMHHEDFGTALAFVYFHNNTQVPAIGEVRVIGSYDEQVNRQLGSIKGSELKELCYSMLDYLATQAASDLGKVKNLALDGIAIGKELQQNNPNGKLFGSNDNKESKTFTDLTFMLERNAMFSIKLASTVFSSIATLFKSTKDLSELE